MKVIKTFHVMSDAQVDVIDPIRALMNECMPPQKKGVPRIKSISVTWSKQYTREGFPISATVEYEVLQKEEEKA